MNYLEYEPPASWYEPDNLYTPCYECKECVKKEDQVDRVKKDLQRALNILYGKNSVDFQQVQEYLENVCDELEIEY